MPAPELRRLFQGYREGLGGMLYPSYPSNPVPGMACYDPSKCHCLHYETGDDKTWGTENRSSHGNFFRDSGCPAKHSIQRNTGTWCDQQMRVTKHWPYGAENSVCLVTAYQHNVQLFCKADLGTGHLNPSHGWCHAMDLDTYSWPEAGLDLPLCRKKDYMNYYRRPKTVRCIMMLCSMHHQCICALAVGE